MLALDLRLLRAFYASGASDGWVDAWLAVSFLGSGWMLLLLVPPLVMRRYAALRRPIVILLVTLLATSAVVSITKSLAGRVRPCQALAWAHTLAVAVPDDPSFPSGHAAGSFALATFVLARNRRAGVWLLVAAAFVAISRVALGVHYPSDVAAGAVLGAAMGWWAGKWAIREGQREQEGGKAGRGLV